MKLSTVEELRAQPIPAAVVAEARVEAKRGGRRILDCLAERLSLSEQELTLRLAASFRYPRLSMDDLRTLIPAFDRIPYP